MNLSEHHCKGGWGSATGVCRKSQMLMLTRVNVVILPNLDSNLLSSIAPLSASRKVWNPSPALCGITFSHASLFRMCVRVCVSIGVAVVYTDACKSTSARAGLRCGWCARAIQHQTHEHRTPLFPALVNWSMPEKHVSAFCVYLRSVSVWGGVFTHVRRVVSEI